MFISEKNATTAKKFLVKLRKKLRSKNFEEHSVVKEVICNIKMLKSMDSIITARTNSIIKSHPTTFYRPPIKWIEANS